MSLLRLPRPTALVTVALAASIAVAACGSAEGPGWTYAPAPSVTPAASSAASGSPAASGSTPPASQPVPSSAATGSPAASADTGTTVTVVATVPTQFDTTELTAPADQPFTLVFDNQDATVVHNVVLQNPDQSPVDIGDTTPFLGPEQRSYDVPALAAGAYPFLCQVHPTTMTGTLTVQ
jgi:plastocyanin